MEMSKAENAWFVFKDDNPDLFEAEWDNYKSPISVIVPDVLNQLEVNIEKSVVSAISDLGISVDKAELIRALQYDRGQYVMGFQDGWRAANEKIVHCKDCKHTDTDGCGAIYCEKWDRWEMSGGFFCSYGERKEQCD